MDRVQLLSRLALKCGAEVRELRMKYEPTMTLKVVEWQASGWRVRAADSSSSEYRPAERPAFRRASRYRKSSWVVDLLWPSLACSLHRVNTLTAVFLYHSCRSRSL
jgi:hypothetical protein